RGSSWRACKATPAERPAWPSPRTANGWRPAARTARRGSGTWPRGGRAPGCASTKGACGRWPSGRTAGRWRRAARTGRCGCGGWAGRPAKAGRPAAGDPLDRLVRELARGDRTDEQVVEALYLAALGRFPSEAETKTVTGHVAKQKDRREAALEDVLWALINSKEFSAHVQSLAKRAVEVPKP